MPNTSIIFFSNRGSPPSIRVTWVALLIGTKNGPRPVFEPNFYSAQNGTTITINVQYGVYHTIHSSVIPISICLIWVDIEIDGKQEEEEWLNCAIKSKTQSKDKDSCHF